MRSHIVPVALVHGWKSHPGIWNRLTPRLNEEGIPFWNFDYTSLDGASMEEIAGALLDFIATQREEWGYAGSIDVVCHSIGSCIARYLLEVTDGSARHEQVRQLIAIGPPNNGSSLAELFCDSIIGPVITARLSGTFVPRDFDPAADVIVQACPPGSRTMAALRRPASARISGIVFSVQRTLPGFPHSSPYSKERPVNWWLTVDGA